LVERDRDRKRGLHADGLPGTATSSLSCEATSDERSSAGNLHASRYRARKGFSRIAPYAIAGAITLLLFAGIYGAWDLTLWMIKNREKT
jgi:hypothetical protein